MRMNGVERRKRGEEEDEDEWGGGGRGEIGEMRMNVVEIGRENGRTNEVEGEGRMEKR